MNTNIANTTFYADFENVKVNNGYVYYWSLADFIKPSPQGHLSSKSLYELDCKTPRKIRQLSASHYKMPMAKSIPDFTNNEAGEWTYPQPGTSGGDETEAICQLNDLISGNK